MKAFAQFQCEICQDTYDTAAAARKCEAKGIDKAIVKAGDIVLMGKCFGWYDGDRAWVSNPDVRENLNDTGKTAFGANKPVCPKGDSNCFDSCCGFEFYYVVTAVDTDPDYGHRTRYHVETLAMTGKQGYRGPGFTFNRDHHRPKLVKSPPAAVVKASKKLLGHKAKYLF